MALQADGKIVLIGEKGNFEGIIVRRYTSSGLLDTAFGDNGTVAVPRPSEYRAMESASIALQPDGRIVGVGWEFELGQPYYDAIVVFRLNEDGSFDETFGPDGTGVARIIAGYAGGQVLVQPNGKILVAGLLINFADILPTPVIVRYNKDGSLDSSFGDSGVVTDHVGGPYSEFSGAAVQPDGKIVAIGRTVFTETPQSFVVRYNSDGSPDAGFGTNGVSLVDPALFNFPDGVVLTPDRRIVVTGRGRDDASGVDGFAIIRLASDGVLDPSFGIGGRSLLSVLGLAADVAIQHDGRILVAGSLGENSIAVIRVTAGPRFGRPRRSGLVPTPAPEPWGSGVTFQRLDGAPH